MQFDKFRNDVLIKSIGQFLQRVLPTTPKQAPITEVEAVPPSRIEKEDEAEYSFGLTATPI
jgi:hypothetical protein